MNQEFYNIIISPKRLFSFIEIELGACPTSFNWMIENNGFYEQIKQAFILSEAYEQASIMSIDEKYAVFFSLIRLDGHPLLVERKEHYGTEDLLMICSKSGYPFNEAFHYCIEDALIKEKWASFIDSKHIKTGE